MTTTYLATAAHKQTARNAYRAVWAIVARPATVQGDMRLPLASVLDNVASGTAKTTR